jgi:hypothetical protein
MIFLCSDSLLAFIGKSSVSDLKTDSSPLVFSSGSFFFQFLLRFLLFFFFFDVNIANFIRFSFGSLFIHF